MIEIDDAVEWRATRAWVEGALGSGERVVGAARLVGGWSSVMRRLRVVGADGERELVLRSFVKPFYLRHAEGLLGREAAILGLLAGSGIPVAECLAVDALGEYCDHPSLLMSLLPGEIRLGDEGVGERIGLLARQLVAVHGVVVGERDEPGSRARPREYQAWTAAERVRVPEGTGRPELWRRAIELIRREPPSYRGCFLHRDFHPGNVLFAGKGADTRVAGVVDWVETSWGPADLDVAHCSTALALLHGPEVGVSFAAAYVAAGGRLAEDPAERRYWRLLDALAFAPDAEKVAVPWRTAGRTDLPAEVTGGRLEAYLDAVLRMG
ncbi:phosphotransferase family protein [Embleya sp. AB8]|uniref:phosphotransferase family protein n=1 Tax=Embleya sp. AB8 TaxID=3156304 RepID=UPI003C7553B9